MVLQCKVVEVVRAALSGVCGCATWLSGPLNRRSVSLDHLVLNEHLIIQIVAQVALPLLAEGALFGRLVWRRLLGDDLA